MLLSLLGGLETWRLGEWILKILPISKSPKLQVAKAKIQIKIKLLASISYSVRKLQWPVLPCCFLALFPRFETISAHHPPKPCAGEEQKVRSKTSSAAHLFVLAL